jgi:hypothetical protein
MSSHAVQKPQITSTGDRLPNMPFSLMLMQIDPTCSGSTPDFGLVNLYLFACSTQLLLRCLYSVSCTRHHLILASNLHHDLWRSCGVSRRLSGAYGLVHCGCLPSSPYAKVCHLDSQTAAIRVVLCIKRHNGFKKEWVVHRERILDALSLDLALHSNIIVHFDSSSSDKLIKHTGRMELFRSAEELHRSSFSLELSFLPSSCEAVPFDSNL